MALKEQFKKLKLLALMCLLLGSAGYILNSAADMEHAVGNITVKFIRSFDHPHSVSSVAWHPNEKFFATGGALSKIISIWDVEKNELVKTIDQQLGGVGALAYSPDGRYLAVGRTFTRQISDKYHINIYDSKSGFLIKSFVPPAAEKAQSNDVKTLSFSKDGKFLAANGYGSWSDGVVYDIEAGDVEAVIKKTKLDQNIASIYSVSFSPDDKYLAVGRSSGVIDVWLKDSWVLSYSFFGHDSGVYSMAYSPDGNLIAAASKNNNINLWNIPDRTLFKSVNSTHIGYVRRLQFTPNGSTLISGGSDKSITLIGMGKQLDMKQLKNFKRLAYPYVSPHGAYLAIATGNRTELWKLKY